MAEKKPVPRNRGMKPNLAVSDTSGGSLSDFKNLVSKAAKVVGAGNKTLSNFTNELTGAGAIGRAIDNPSKKTVASAVVGVGAAALPFLKLGKAASAAARASDAAITGAVTRSQNTLNAAYSQIPVTKTLRLKDSLGSLYNSGGVSQIVGSKVTTVGPKNVDAVVRGVIMNAANKGVQASAASMAASAAAVKALAVGPVVNALNNTLNPPKTKNKNGKRK